MTEHHFASAGVLAVALLTAGCFPEDENKAPASEAQYGAAWPLTVPEGHIACRNGGEAIFFTGDAVYALNGRAMAENERKDIAEISKPNETFPDVRMSPQPLIDAAIDLC